MNLKEEKKVMQSTHASYRCFWLLSNCGAPINSQIDLGLNFRMSFQTTLPHINIGSYCV
jgi:hypothetical protein